MGVRLSRCLQGGPCIYTWARTCMHKCAHMSNNVITDSPEFPYGGSHLHKIIMFIHVCTCTHMHACMCTCTHAWSIPQTSWQSPTPIHPTPPFQRGGPPKSLKNSIALEQINILQFRFNILDLWILVHSYRLHLVCTWGSVLSQIPYFTFGPKNVHIFCSCGPSAKNFPVFTLESNRPCLDWQSISFFTS